MEVQDSLGISSLNLATLLYKREDDEGEVSIIKLMLQKGASVELKDVAGNDAFHNSILNVNESYSRKT